jgi:hypothetical protein
VANNKKYKYFDDRAYKEDIKVEKERIRVYLTDELGYLKVWDLTHFIQGLGIKKAPNYPENKMSFNPKRKE